MVELSNISLRWSDASDADVVASLVQQLLLEISTQVGHDAFAVDVQTLAQTVRRWLDQGHYLAVLAYDGDQPVGVTTVTQSYALYAGGPIGIVQECFVQAGARSCGVGARMIERVMEMAKRRGWSGVELCTPPLPQFDRALDFYQRHDFVVAGGRKMRRKL